MFDTSNYEDRPQPKGKNKKVIELINDKLGGKMMNDFVRSTAQTYSYLVDDGVKLRKAKGQKTCVIKSKLKFENYKNCLEKTQL